MNRSEFYRRFRDLRGAGFITRARRDVRVARACCVLGLCASIIGITFFSGLVRDILLAFGFAVLGASATMDVSIRRRAEVWPLIDAIIDWNRLDEKTTDCQQDGGEERRTGPEI